jgi:hypothetical protein
LGIIDQVDTYNLDVNPQDTPPPKGKQQIIVSGGTGLNIGLVVSWINVGNADKPMPNKPTMWPQKEAK